MRYLLDTHVCLWMGTKPERLGEGSRALLLDRNNELYLSIVSVWEILLKTALGKLRLPLDVQTFVRRFLPANQSALLELSLDHVFASGLVANKHRDPFDRMLIAQARVEGMTLMTADSAMLCYPVATFDARQ